MKEPKDENPLKIIESDIVRLIKKVNELEYEYNKLNRSWEEEVKRFLLEIFEVLDSLEERFKNLREREKILSDETKMVINSFRTIYKLFLRALESFDVRKVEVYVGDKLNPYWHRVIETEKCLDKEDETILEELKSGYIWRGKLIRPSEVKVVKNK